MPKYATLTATEVAEFLSASRASIWRWAKAGMIPAPIKIGGSTRWRLSDLEAYLDGLEPIQAPAGGNR